MSQGAWTTFCCPKGQQRAPQSSIQTLSTPGRNFSGKADLLNPAIYFHHHFSNHKSADCRLRDRRSPQGTDERPALVRLLAESENDRRLAHRGSSETRLSDRRKQRPRSRQSRFQRGPQKPVRNRRSAAPPVSLLQRLCKRHGIVHLSGSIPPKVSQSSAKSPQTSRPATAYRAEVPLASPAWIEAGMTYEI